ncbi:FV3-083R, partial [Symbiodinium pilosum]
MDVVYTARSSQNELDGYGCQERRVFSVFASDLQPAEEKPEAAQKQIAEQPLAEYWDFVFIRNLMSNASHRPLHDFVMAAEYVAVARIKHQLRAALSSYIKCVKTDCVVVQQLPKKHQHLLQELQDLKHPDGSQVYRVEEGKPLRGYYREPQLPEHAMPPELEWTDFPDPLTHCLAGGSLLLTGLPGTGKTHLARKIVAALREQGQAAHIVAKTHSSVQNIGDFRQLPAALDSFAGTEVLRELRQAQLIKTLARGYRHELVENKRSDHVIFDFLRWLRIDEPDETPLSSALREAWVKFPERHGLVPDTALVISHRHRIQLNGWVNQAKAPEGAAVFEYSPAEPADMARPPTRGMGRSSEKEDLFKYTRLTHAITHASCQGLTLIGHVELFDTSSQHFTLRHLYVGSSRATRS